MMENAWYYVISPEGCSSIVWEDAGKKQEMSDIMKLTGSELQEMGIVDRVVDEPLGGAIGIHLKLLPI